MAETKFTTGPWVLYEGGNFIWIGAPGYLEYVAREHYLGGPFGICSLNDKQTEDHEQNHEQALYNAYLIAASPDLYAALDGLLRICLAPRAEPLGTHNLETIMNAVEALAKARGEK